MKTNEGLSHAAFRSILDSVEEILGTNGKNAILQFAGFSDFIENPIEYDTEKRMGIEHTTRLYMSIREIIGNKGYNSLMYRGGIITTNNVMKHSEGLRALRDYESTFEEKLNHVYTAYIYTIGLKPEEALEFYPDKKEILIHRRPTCNECEFVIKDKSKIEEITRPGCYNILGGVHQVGNLRPDMGSVTAEEIKCALIGDDECLFCVRYELK